MERFPIRRIVLASDRSLLGRDNVDELQEAADDKGRMLEIALASQSRRCKDPP